MVATPPPSKKEQLNKLLERGSVFVHLDPRREGVSVPTLLAKKPQLVLQLGLNFPIPIRDLEIDEAGVRCTLSFNRAPFYCVLPWSAVYALVAEDGQVTVWPSDLPSELVPQVEPAVRRAAPRDRGEKREKRPRISVVPNPPPESGASATDEADALDDALAAAEQRATPPERRRPSLAPALPAPADEANTASPAEPASHASADETIPSQPVKQPTRTTRERPPHLRLIK